MSAKQSAASVDGTRYGAKPGFIKGFHGVRYQSRDVGRAIEFYTRHLGFELEHERTAMVRHTTAPAVVHARLAPIPVEAGERVPRGIPTYVRNARRTGPEQGAGSPSA